MSFQNMRSACAIAVALFAASNGVYAATADAASATINITAEVTGATCTPSWNGSTPVSIDLGQVSATDMAAKGDVGSLKPFTLKLSDCDKSVSKVAVIAGGTADATDPTAFANTLTGDSAASGVAVALFGGDDQATQIQPGSTTPAEYSVTNGAAEMTFMAKLLRTAADDKGVTNGKVSSTATLYMSYE